MATQAGVADATTPRLRNSVLGLLAVAGIGAVIMSPSLGLYFVFGSIASATGPISPLIYLLALVISIPTAISYAMVGKELPAAGQAYTWLWRAMRPEVGLWIGMIVIFYFMSGLWINAITNSVFFSDFLRFFGVPQGPILNIIGILILFGLTAFVVYRDIRINARVALGFLAFESVSAAALGLTILIVKASQGTLSFEPFNPSAATAGFTGVSTAAIFGILAFIGYDYSAVVAEEAKTPRRLVPLAVVLTTVVLGLYWIIFSWGYAQGASATQLAQFASSGFEPATPMAKIYWGAGNIIIPITGLTATIGIYVATVPVLARVVFAMGRDGSLPRWFAALRPNTQIPGNASTAVLIVAFVGPMVMGLLQGGFLQAFAWFGAVSVFFALVTYIFVNAANFMFYRRFRPQKFNLLWNVIVPLVAIVIDAYVLWQSFFVALWSAGWALGSSVIVFALVVCVLAIVYAMWMRLQNAPVLKQESYVLPDVPETT